MKLPPNTQFLEDRRLFAWRPRGLVNEAAVNQIIAALGKLEATSSKPFNRFTDSSTADAVELNFKYIFHVSLFRRLSYAGRPPVKSAILVTNETFGQYSRMHALLTRGSPLQVRIFETRAETAKWLGVPQETLEA